MSSIIEKWNTERIRYQQRYARFVKKWNEYHNEDDRGHLTECSYVLINIFGLTKDQVEELEQDYIGLTKKDLEDDLN